MNNEQKDNTDTIQTKNKVFTISGKKVLYTHSIVHPKMSL